MGADPALWSALALAGAAGLSMPLGALLAFSGLAHFLGPIGLRWVVGFGGGALVSAVALVLVPEGAATLPAPVAIAAFLSGGLIFFVIDRALERGGGGGGLVMALLLDYLPEALALGAVLTRADGTAALLAGLIFLQNVPEGYVAVLDIRKHARASTRQIIIMFSGLALLGPACAGLGFVWLAGLGGTLGAVTLFAAGGILYLVFQDVAPESHDQGRWSPPLGAVLGFALGLAGHLATA